MGGARTGKELHNLELRFKLKFLDLEIKVTIRNLHFLHTNIDNLDCSIKSILALHIWEQFQHRQLNIFSRKFNKIKNDNRNKINNLQQQLIKAVKTKSSWLKTYLTTKYQIK